MKEDVVQSIYDALLPGWRDMRLVTGNRVLACPLHDDRNPSLHVHEEKGTWICRAGCGGGGAWDLAVRMLGDAGARDLLRQLESASGTRHPTDFPNRIDGIGVGCRVGGADPDVSVIGDPTSGQVKALKRTKRLTTAETLTRIGAKAVRWHSLEWLGIPNLAGGWKLWALDCSGRPRLDENGKLIRRNAGPVSIVVSPDLMERDGAPIPRLFDLEGESDLLAWIDRGGIAAIAGTGGAGSLAGHDRHADWLERLRVEEAVVGRDLDHAGREGKTKAAAWWLARGIRVRVLELPADLGDGGDVRDYLLGRLARDGKPPLGPFGGLADLDALADAAAVLEPERLDLVVEPLEEEIETHSLTLPPTALRGSFGEVAEYLRDVTGARVEHVFGAWWATLAIAIGSRRWGTWSGRVVPATYSMLIGPTGDHKTTAIDRCVELLPSGIQHVDGVTSDAGLFDALEEAPDHSALLHFDELGFLLRMAALSGSTLNPMLNRLWSAPAHLDRNLSRRSKQGGGPRRIERPFACIVGGTHVSTFWREIGDDGLALGSGFVNRLAPFCVEEGRSLPETAEPDQRLALELTAHLERLTKLEPSPVELTGDARTLWRQFSIDHDKRVANLPPQYAAATKRIRDHVARLALSYTVDAGGCAVTPDALVAAIEVGAYLEASYQHLLAGRLLDRGPARAAGVEEISRRLLRKAPSRWHAIRDLQRSWPTSPSPGAEELRRVLGAMEDVQSRENPKNKQHRQYRYEQGSTTRHPTLNYATSNAQTVGCRVAGAAEHPQ